MFRIKIYDRRRAGAGKDFGLPAFIQTPKVVKMPAGREIARYCLVIHTNSPL